MPAKPTLYSTVSDATRAGVSVQRHRISRDDANRIKSIERNQGHDAALRALLQLLFKPRES
jgi:hypothetical protein